MKYLFAAAMLLLVIAETPAQQVEAKSVTITSYVYGNRYCARLPIVASVMSKTFGADRGEGLPGPTGNCLEACTSDGARYLAVFRDDKGYA